MVLHIVYFVILVTIQRQFINGQHRGIHINIASTGIASLYFQCYNTISYLGHPRGSEKYRFVNMCGLVHLGHVYFVLSRLYLVHVVIIKSYVCTTQKTS